MKKQYKKIINIKIVNLLTDEYSYLLTFGKIYWYNNIKS